MNPIVKELTVGFGFLNGIWFAIGTSPQTEALKLLNQYSASMPPVLQKILIIMPLILMTLTIITMIKIYYKGGMFGSLTVMLAFFAGAIIFNKWQTSIIILTVAIILGLISFTDEE
jgi:hypothetical protein